MAVCVAVAPGTVVNVASPPGGPMQRFWSTRRLVQCGLIAVAFHGILSALNQGCQYCRTIRQVRTETGERRTWVPSSKLMERDGELLRNTNAGVAALDDVVIASCRQAEFLLAVLR
jgi:hypothetical protein